MSTILSRMSLALPARGELNWDDEINAILTYLDTNAGLLGTASSWSALQTYSAGLTVSAGYLATPRARVRGGTALTTANVSLGSGWGSTATKAVGATADGLFTLSITASGSGIAINPTIVVTFADGAWPSGPMAFVNFLDTGTGTPALMTATCTTTDVTLTYRGTPSSGLSYNFAVLVVGR